MTSSAMEIIEAAAKEPASCVRRSQWLHCTISGVDEKMKVILALLEDDDSPLQNDEICVRKKENITKVVQDLCISYRNLAEKYESLKNVAIDVHTSESSSLFSNKSKKILEDLGAWNDSQLETTNSNPESSVEDADTKCEGTMADIEHIKRTADSLVPKGGSSIQPENAWFDGVKYKFSKLVEENTQLQVELIRRNSEKRETIIKLQTQVSRLRVENDTLKRTLNYNDHNKQHIQESSPRRKSILLDKFFRGCSP
ncbi:protein NETWORKED 2C-like [Chenopodium quinoa]|nr:protein NETWORKED 2C-like [Chenopodium quinoa]